MVGQRMAAVNPDAVSGTAGLLLERASMRLNLPPVLVTRGLDPRVHFPRKKMDCRVKTGNDEQSQSDGTRPSPPYWTHVCFGRFFMARWS